MVLAVCTAAYVFFALGNPCAHHGEWDHLAVVGMYIACVPLYIVLLRGLYSVTAKTKAAAVFCTLGGSTLGIYVLNERFIMPLSRMLVFPLASVLAVLSIAVPVTALCWAVTTLIRKNKLLRNYTLGEK